MSLAGSAVISARTGLPVTVAVDATGESVHATGPLVWREKIAKQRALEMAE